MRDSKGWSGRWLESGDRRAAASLRFYRAAGSDAATLRKDISTGLCGSGITVYYTVDAFPFVMLRKHIELGDNIVFQDDLK